MTQLKNAPEIGEKRRELAAHIAAQPLRRAEAEKSLTNQIWVKEKEIQYINAEKYKYENMLAESLSSL